MKYNYSDYHRILLKDAKPGQWVVFGLSPRTASVSYAVTDDVDQEGNIGCIHTGNKKKSFFPAESSAYFKKSARLVDNPVLFPDKKPEAPVFKKKEKRTPLSEIPELIETSEYSFNPLIN